jgi:dCTP deaminase
VLLSDREATAVMTQQVITIIPLPAPELFTSTAVDLTLDKRLVIWEPKPQSTGQPPEIRPFGEDFDVRALMNNPNWARKTVIDSTHGFKFATKRQFILAYTRERICLPHTSRIAARVEGKSSLARLGIGVHVTAPTIHPGFGYKQGVSPKKTAQPIQLEMFNLTGLPVTLDVGMPICQLILEEVREVPNKGYQGQFNQQPVFAAPATPSPSPRPRRSRNRSTES